jgi:hypothetical protein
MQLMRRVARLALATLVVGLTLLPGAAHAARTGTIEGRVVDGTTGRPRTNVEVRLQGGKAAGGDAIERSVTTDEQGRYSFGDLPTGDDRFYVVDALFQGGLFPGRALTLPADTSAPPVIKTTTRVWETTTDPTVIGLPRDDLFAISSDDGLGVIESVSILNSSDLAYIGRGGEDDSAGEVPTIGFALPEGAGEVQIQQGTTLDIPKLVATDFGFAATVAIPPGESSVTFSYSLPDAGAQFELSRNALYPTGEISIYTRPPLTVSSNRLIESGEKSIEGTIYNLWTTKEGLIDSGDPVQILLVADAGRSSTLYAGVGAFAVVLLIVAVIGLRRIRRVPRRAGPASATPMTREQILTKIAELDLAFESGDLTKADWERQRAGLKKRVAGEDTAS